MISASINTGVLHEVANVEVDVVEAVGRARVRSVVKAPEYTRSPASSRRQQQDGVRRMAMVDQAAEKRTGGLPSATSAAVSARERQEARTRIKCRLDEDQRRMAPPAEKAATPAMMA